MGILTNVGMDENAFPVNYEFVAYTSATSGHLNVLKYTAKSYPKWDASVTKAVIELADFELLSWAKSQGLLDREHFCDSAAESGHLAALQWGRKNRFKWDAGTCSSAARYGRLKILKWARENGCPWDDRTTYEAVKHGYLEILQWAVANGCELCRYFPTTVERRHPDIYHWLNENYPE